MIQGLSSKSYNLTWDNYYRYDDVSFHFFNLPTYFCFIRMLYILNL
jgi:hypothetical protein